MIIDFLIGIITGAGVVSSSVNRTLAIAEGNTREAFISSVINSTTYGASIYFIAKGDWISYFGTAIGSTLVCVYMAIKKKNKFNRGIANGDKERSNT